MKALHRSFSVALAAGLLTLTAAAAGASGDPSRIDARTALHTARHLVNPGGVVRGLHTRLNGQQTSGNWAGYVATAGSYTHIFGRWHVPTVAVTADDRYSSTWVGIGGDPTVDLIQAGTEQDSVAGHTVYTAWTEILPEPETFAFNVNAGDSISVDIATGLLPVLWTITLRDETTGQSIVRSTPYPSLMMTAEWIHEAPTVGGFVANLARTNNAVFDNGTVNGTTIANAGGLNTIVMLDANNNQVATPGGLDSEGDGFQVADGASAPPPPGS